MKKFLVFPLLAACLFGCSENNVTKEDKINQQENSQEQQGGHEQTTTYYDWKYSIDFSTVGYEDGQSIKKGSLSFTTDIKFNFLEVGTGDKKTSYYDPSVRFYSGNTFSITSENHNLTKINLIMGTGDKENAISVNNGSLNNTTWTGESKDISFSIGGTSGHRRVDKVEVFYKDTTAQPIEEPIINPQSIDLGVKTIAEVKTYISENPVAKNSYGNGVNNLTYVTIQGLALAKIDLVKSTANYGLNVSEPAKVIIGDETGAIACASKTTQGSLWYKVDDHCNESTSKYSITGYISEYLGHPELLVISYVWDKTLNVECNPTALSKETLTIAEAYDAACGVTYNCAGHGYGDIVTLNNLRCYYMEADGAGKRYYQFTDGTKNIRVNAFNISSCSVGQIYNITGIISLKNHSTAIVALTIVKPQNENTVNFDYQTASNNVSIDELKTTAGSGADTMTKNPNLINAYENIYSQTGYFAVVQENGKLYVGFASTYIDEILTGKTSSMANDNVMLIKNDNFWNVSETQLATYNPFYEDYIYGSESITIYFILRQVSYSSGKACIEILLIPDFINDFVSSK